jgi:hypothetical protein
MKVLNVRFSESQRLKVSEYAELLNMIESDVARAALYIGLNEIAAIANKDTDRGIEFTSLNAIKSK